MNLVDSKFQIPADKKTACLEVIKKGCGSGLIFVNTDKFLDAATLDDAMFYWRWIVGKDEGVLFKAIAPFVEKGSYVEMEGVKKDEGESGMLWRWDFDGKECVETKRLVARRRKAKRETTNIYMVKVSGEVCLSTLVTVTKGKDETLEDARDGADMMAQELAHVKFSIQKELLGATKDHKYVTDQDVNDEDYCPIDNIVVTRHKRNQKEKVYDLKKKRVVKLVNSQDLSGGMVLVKNKVWVHLNSWD